MGIRIWVIAIVFGFLILGEGVIPASPVSVLQQVQRWITEVEVRHPMLLSLRQRIEAQGRRVQPAGILPDPIVSLSVRNVRDPAPLTTLGEEMMSMAGIVVQQPIPWKGKLGTRRQAADAMMSVWEREYELMRWRLVGALSRQAFELAFVQEKIDILNESLSLLNQLIAIAEALYAVGRGTQSDVLRAYTERSRLDEQIETADKARQTLVQQIREQFLVTPDRPIPRLRLPEVVPDLPPDDVLYAQVERNAPEIRRLQARIAWQETRVELARLDRYPDFVLRAGWFFRGSLPGIFEVGIGLDVPLFAGSKQIPLYEAETFDLEALQQQLEDIRYRLRWRVQDAALRARTARRLIDLYRTEILPQAQADYESALDNYQTGRLDFLNVMDRWLRWLNFRITYYRQLTDYLQALATIEEIAGFSILSNSSGVTDQASAVDRGMADGFGGKP